MIRVIGDIMLDRWIACDVSRMSPEASVPIALEVNRESSLGGAANVSVSLRNLGQSSVLYGSVGGDNFGEIVKELLSNGDIDSRINNALDKTTVKTRVVDLRGNHITRIDSECKCESDLSVESLLLDIDESDLVVISDYNKGVIRSDSLEKILKRTNFVFIDPKKEPECYANAYLIKPNMKEYNSWNGAFDSNLAINFMKQYNWRWMVVTDGENGIHLLGNNGEYYNYKERAREVADVAGAGDVVISVLAHCYSSGMSMPESCKAACVVASRSVEQRGVSHIEGVDLKKVIKYEK